VVTAFGFVRLFRLQLNDQIASQAVAQHSATECWEFPRFQVALVAGTRPAHTQVTQTVGQSHADVNQKGVVLDDNAHDADRRDWSNSAGATLHLPCFRPDRSRSNTLGSVLYMHGR